MPIQEAYEEKLKDGMNNLTQEVTPSRIIYDNVMRSVNRKKTVRFGAPGRNLAIASVAVTLIMIISFSSNVSAVVDRMMYLIVRDGGKYKVVETPYDENKFDTYTAVNLPNAEEVLGQTVNLPAQITIDNSSYKSGEGIICSNNSTGEKFFTIKYLSNNIKTETQLKSSLNYVFLEISKYGQLLEAGDNAKTIKHNGLIMYWGENPYSDRPSVTEKPDTVKVFHSLAWEENGLYYRIIPGEGFDIPVETALEAADAVINFEK